MDRDWANGLVVGVGELAGVRMLECCSSSCLIRNGAQKGAIRARSGKGRMYRDVLEAASRRSSAARVWAHK